MGTIYASEVPKILVESDLKVKTKREVMQIVVGMKRRGHWLLESRSMNKTFSHNQIILRSEVLRADC